MASRTDTRRWRNGINSDAAKRRIVSFSKHFGKEHLYFAQHAAFPLAVTPELLYQLWANFQQDIHGEILNIPWIAVADLLLSGLFDEVGHELFEMDMLIRAALLNDLKTNNNFGAQRVVELSHFLSRYIERQLESYDPYQRDIAITQKWTVLAHTAPNDAARALALSLRESIEQNNLVEQVRMVSLIETFAEPLAGFAPLITYARGIGYQAQGDTVEALAQFKTIDSTVDVAGVKLQVPVDLNDKQVDSQQIRGRAESIANIISIRASFLKDINSKQERLHKLAQTLLSLEELSEQIIKSGPSNLIELVKDLQLLSLREKVEGEIQSLEKAKQRFRRATLNIAVIGRAGQGKSTLLQSLSGLDGTAIPTSHTGDCTGVRSVIRHDDTQTPGGKISFYSEQDFINDVLSSYYQRLGLKPVPTRLDDFINQPLPAPNTDVPGHAVLAEMRRRLEKYKIHIQKYKDLIGSLDRTIELKYVREYVAQETPDGQDIYFNYLAVREATITCQFNHPDVDQIALVDLPGLGDMGVGDDERLVKTLGEDIDIVIFVIMPHLRSVLLDVDFVLYDLMYNALKGIPIDEWSFMVLNHRKSTVSEQDNYNSCERIRQQIKGGSLSTHGPNLKVIDCMIADCSNPAEAREIVLEPILAYLTENLGSLDKLYMSFWQVRFATLQKEINVEIEKVQADIKGFSPFIMEESSFEQLFRTIWSELLTAIEGLLDKLEKESHIANPLLADYFRNKIENCRSDTGISSSTVIEARSHSIGSYTHAFYYALDEMRTHLTNHFADIDERLNLAMDDLRMRVAKVFLENGRLESVMRGKPDSNFFNMMASEETLSSQLQQAFQVFAEYKLSFRGFFQSRIRRQLNNITPDKTQIRPETLTPEGISATLVKLHRETVDQLEVTLNNLLHEPNEAAWAITEEFVDQTLRSKNAKDAWRLFYHVNKAKVWAPEFEMNTRWSELWYEWQQRVKRTRELNTM
jgi:hypothetical protein